MSFTVTSTVQTGTVSIAQYSDLVTGTGTSFASADVGKIIQLGSVGGIIDQWISATLLRLRKPVTTAQTGVSFSIVSAIAQSGTDTDLTGLSAISGVTTTIEANTGNYPIRTIDFGAVPLTISGTLTIPNRNFLAPNATSVGNVIAVASTGVLIVDGRYTLTRNGVSKTVYSELCGIMLRKPSGTPYNFYTLDVAGRLEQYGGVLETSATLNFQTTSKIIARDAVWRVYDRQPYGYMNIYVRTDDLDIDGLDIMGNGSTLVGWQKAPKAGGQLSRYQAQGVAQQFAAIDGLAANVVARNAIVGESASDFDHRYGGTTAIDLGTRAIGASPVGGYDFVDAVGSVYSSLESTTVVNSQSTGATRQWVTYTPQFLDATNNSLLSSGVLYLVDKNNGNRKATNGASADVVIIASMSGGLISAQSLLTTVWTGLGSTIPQLTRDNRLPIAGGLWAYSHNFVSAAVVDTSPLQSPTLYAVADTNVTLSESAARSKLASSFTVNTTTKIVTVTASSTLDDVYDVLKAFKATATAANLTAAGIANLIATPNGKNLTGATGWTLVVSSGVTLSAGSKYNYVYFPTVINNGTISTTFADSTGTRVSITELTGRAISTYVTINGTAVGGSTVNGTFVAGWVSNTVSRTITVQPTDNVRIVAGYWGSKPILVNCLGSEIAKFTLTFEIDPAVDTTISTTNRNAIANSLLTITNGTTGNIEATFNQSLAAYTPNEVISAIAYDIITTSYQVFAACAAANTVGFYSLSSGRIVFYSPNYKFRMADTAVGGAAITPNATGYSIPIVTYYYNVATGVASPVTLLNASNAKLETAPWTQATATLSDSDKAAIASASSASVWAAATRTLTSAAAPTATQVATAVRTELATELARVDTTISSRLPTTSYTAPTTPPTVAQIRQEIDTNSTKLDVAVGTRLASAAYTSPDNTSIASIKTKVDTLSNGPTLAQIEASTVLAKEATASAIKAKTDNLPASPAAVGSAMTLTTAYDAAKTALPASGYTAPPTAAQNASAVRTELVNELARIDTSVSSRLATTGYVAPANSDIAAIKSKTDVLVNAPTVSEIEASTVLAKEATLAAKASQASVTALGSPMQASSYVAPANTTIAEIKTKVDSLQNTDLTAVSNALTDIKGTGYDSTKHNLVKIKQQASLAAALSA